GELGREAEQLSRAILSDFSLRASFNIAQSPSTLSWLADAVDKILEFEDPRAALALPKRPKHRPRGVGIARAFDVACWVKLAIKRGYPQAEAHNLAATLFAYDVRSVRRIGRVAAQWVTGMNPNTDWDKYFKSRGRPLPKPKNADSKS